MISHNFCRKEKFLSFKKTILQITEKTRKNPKKQDQRITEYTLYSVKQLLNIPYTVWNNYWIYLIQFETIYSKITAKNKNCFSMVKVTFLPRQSLFLGIHYFTQVNNEKTSNIYEALESFFFFFFFGCCRYLWSLVSGLSIWLLYSFLPH